MVISKMAASLRVDALQRACRRAFSSVGTLHLPQQVRIGAGVSKALPEVLQTLGAKSPLLVTDSFMHDSGLMSPMIEALEAAAIHHAVFSGVVPDPTTDSLDAGVAAAAASGCDVVVGFGGGSSLDSAKAIAVLAVHGGRMRDYKVPNEAPAGLPVVCVPTTAGTGSEVTRVSIITDSASDEKMLCMGPGMLAAAALVDYELSMQKPFRLTADSGLDTLCHALEAYVSRKATPFTDTLALAALKAVVEHLPTACESPSDRRAREAMMLAATQAGIAFSNASVTLIHGLSRPIGAHFHVPHGLSNAMLLPAVTEWSLGGAPERYATCSRAMGFASAAMSDAEALTALLSGLRALSTRLRVPSLIDFGVAPEAFLSLAPVMAKQALASGSPANNPLVPTAEDCVGLYRQLISDSA